MQLYCIQQYCFILCIGTSQLHKPTKDTVNPAYHTITDDHRKKPVGEPVSYYEEVNKPPDPAYAVP